MFTRFLNRAGLKAGEGPAVGRLFLLFFLVSLGNGVGLSTSESLFIRNWGIERLPPAFLAAALTVLLSGLLLTRLGSGVALPKFFARVYAAAVVWVFFLGLSLSVFDLPRLGSALLFLTAYAFLVILKNLLLQVSEAVFDLRQMKRVFALVSSGAVLGMAVGGFAIAPLLRLIHDSRALVFLWGLALLGALALFAVVRVKHLAGPVAPEAGGGAPVGLGGTVKAIAHTPVLLILALLAFGTAFTVVHFDFLYMFAVRKTYSDPEEMTRVFGMVRGVGTLATFLVQITLTGVLIRRLGLVSVLLIFPVTFMAFMGLILARFGMANVMAGRLSYYLTKEAFFFPALQPVFNALAEPLRRGSVFLVYTVCASLGTLAGGLFLMGLVSTGIITPKASAWVSLGLLAVLVVSVLVLKRAYVAELLKNLQEPSPRQLDRLEDLRELGGKDASRLLTGLLQSGDSATVRFALEFLSKQATPELDAAVEEVGLHSGEAPVVQAVFRYFGPRPSTRLLEHARGYLSGPSAMVFLDWVGSLPHSKRQDEILSEATKVPDMRLSAVARLLRFRHTGGEEDRGAIAASLDGQDVEHRRFLLERMDGIDGVWVSVLERHLAGDLHHGEKAQRYLHAMLERAHPGLTRQAAALCRKDPGHRRIFQRAIASVRRPEAAAVIAGIFPGEPDLVVHLAVMPEAARETFCEISLHTDLPAGVRLLAAVRLGEVPAPEGSDMTERFGEGARRALEEALHDKYLRERARSRDGEVQGILGDELERMAREKSHLAFSLLRVGWGPLGLGSAVTGLESNQKEVRAAALETLENSLPKPLAQVLVLLLEGSVEQWRGHIDALGEAKPIPAALDRLFQGGSAWRRALALHLCTRFDIPPTGAMALGVEGDHPVVAEAWETLGTTART